MRHIKKYDIFEKRDLGTREKYLKALIDEDGKLHKKKGYIINAKRNGDLVELIVDSEWTYKIDDANKDKEKSPNRIHEYIAGIDSNGYIIGFNFDERTDELKNSKGEVVYKEIGKPWKRNSNIEDYKFNEPEYSELVDLETGWVNVKIDREVVKKVERFSNRLSNASDIEGLREKLNKLKNPLSKVIFRNDDFTSQIQQKISSLLLLKYLEEIKEKFNATSGGFLFESFIAGLLGGNVPDDNSKVDIVSKDGRKTFQVKLVDWMSDSGNIRLFPPVSIEVLENGVLKKKRVSKNHLLTWQNRNDKSIKEQKLFCDFYLIGLKQNNKIYIYILNTKTTLGKYLINSGISLSKLRDEVTKGSRGKEGVYFELNLADLEDKIQKVSDDLKETLNSIWINLSEIEYNVETITTGQDKKGQTIDWNTCDDIFIDSSRRLTEVDKSLTNLKGVMTQSK